MYSVTRYFPAFVDAHPSNNRSIEMTDCFQFDLDGTLADLSHRLHYIQDGKDWDSFFKEMVNDAPYEDVVFLAQSLHPVIVCSARPDDYRQETEQWLVDHDIPFDALYMRDSGDFRRDDIVKEQVLERIKDDGWNPVVIFDDRRRVVELWRELGYTCAQVNDWPEWKSPRKATLHILIGPTGAGKTTYAESRWNRDMIVSSDRIREEVLGDMKDQSKNGLVFSIFHSLIEKRLELGLDTVADATNIKRKDRKAVTDLANESPVVYHIVNRSMKEKLESPEWRWVELLEKHESAFNQNLEWILDGDGFENVTVEDHRVS